MKMASSNSKQKVKCKKTFNHTQQDIQFCTNSFNNLQAQYHEDMYMNN